MTRKSSPDNTIVRLLQRRHLYVGWLGLLVFLTLGIALEAFHGLKMGFYLDADSSVRRLMWTLCHVHGTLFSLIHIAYACSLGLLPSVAASPSRFVSWCLIGAIVLLPLGFFLGGVQTYGGDPGMGVLIVPLGAMLMLCAVATIVVALWQHRSNHIEPADTSRETAAKSSRIKKRRR